MEESRLAGVCKRLPFALTGRTPTRTLVHPDADPLEQVQPTARAAEIDTRSPSFAASSCACTASSTNCSGA